MIMQADVDQLCRLLGRPAPQAWSMDWIDARIRELDALAEAARVRSNELAAEREAAERALQEIEQRVDDNDACYTEAANLVFAMRRRHDNYGWVDCGQRREVVA